MFHIPMSSPMIKRMFGFLSCAGVATAMNAAHNVTAYLITRSFMSLLPSVWFVGHTMDCREKERRKSDVQELDFGLSGDVRQNAMPPWEIHPVMKLDVQP